MGICYSVFVGPYLECKSQEKVSVGDLTCKLNDALVLANGEYFFKVPNDYWLPNKGGSKRKHFFDVPGSALNEITNEIIEDDVADFLQLFYNELRMVEV